MSGGVQHDPQRAKAIVGACADPAVRTVMDHSIDPYGQPRTASHQQSARLGYCDLVLERRCRFIQVWSGLEGGVFSDRQTA